MIQTNIFTTVYNLADNREVTFSLPAREAVVAAHEQNDGVRANYDASTYDYNKAIISKSGKTIICSNWCALTY